MRLDGLSEEQLRERDVLAGRGRPRAQKRQVATMSHRTGKHGARSIMTARSPIMARERATRAALSRRAALELARMRHAGRHLALLRALRGNRHQAHSCHRVAGTGPYADIGTPELLAAPA